MQLYSFPKILLDILANYDGGEWPLPASDSQPQKLEVFNITSRGWLIGLNDIFMAAYAANADPKLIREVYKRTIDRLLELSRFADADEWSREVAVIFAHWKQPFTTAVKQTAKTKRLSLHAKTNSDIRSPELSIEAIRQCVANYLAQFDKP